MSITLHIEPIAVDRPHAAALLQISEGAFAQYMASGLLPKPRKLNGSARWLVSELRAAADQLPVSDLLPPPGRKAKAT